MISAMLKELVANERSSGVLALYKSTEARRERQRVCHILALMACCESNAFETLAAKDNFMVTELGHIRRIR